MPTFSYRPYQTHPVGVVGASRRDALIDYPTGSGKTVMIVGAASRLLAKGSRVLIATPQQHIEEAFSDRPYSALADAAGRTDQCPAEMIEAARDASGGSVRAVVAYLKAAPAGRALVCTHAALTRLLDPALADTMPADLTDSYLVVDEAHRIGAPALGQVAEAWRRLGGIVVEFTASAFRADGDPVVLKAHPVHGREPLLVRRTLAQHMEEGEAPAGVETEVRAIKVDAVVTVDETTGEAAPPEAVQDAIVADLVKTWRADGRPKSVVRVPVMTGGSGGMVRKVVDAMTAAGARVLDVSGGTKADKDRFLSALPAERRLPHHADSKYDVLVGVQRVTEGLDWPLCSTVYVVGLPASLVLVTQLLGRATRKKVQPDYPAAEAGRARIVFFVPTGKPTDELLAHHRRSTLLVCAFLADATSAAEWAIVKEIGRGLIRPLAPREEADAAVAEAAAAYPRVDPRFRADALKTFAKIRKRLLDAGSTAPDVEVLRQAFAEGPPTPENRNLLRQVMVEWILSETGQPPEAVEKVRRRLRQELTRADGVAKPLAQRIREAFDALHKDLHTFATVTGKRLAKVDSQVVALTGRGMAEIGEKLAEARPLTPEWVAKVCEEYKALHGSYPTGHRTNAPVPGYALETWAGIDAAIGRRERGWQPTGFAGLREFIARYVRFGTVAGLLAKFRADVPPTAAEAALLDVLAAQRVQVNGEIVPFGDTLAPSTAGAAWPPANWWVLREWWDRHFGLERDDLPVLTDAHAAVLLTNLIQWLTAKGHSPGQPPPLSAVAARYAGLTATGRVRAAAPVEVRGGAPAAPGEAFRGTVAAGGLGRALPPLTRLDGVKEADRATAKTKYVRAAVGVEFHVTPQTKKLTTASTSVALPAVAVPLDWVETVGGAEVPAAWNRLGGLAAVLLSRTDAAA